MGIITGTLDSGEPFRKVIGKRTKKIDLWKLQVKTIDLSQIGEAENLELFSTGYNPIEFAELHYLNDCKNLKDLYISMKNPIDLDPLINSKAKVLMLTYGYDEPSPIPTLPNTLEKFYVTVKKSCKLNLSNLPTSVKYLSLSGPFQEVNLSPLSGYSLDHLCIAGVHVKEVFLPDSGLENLKTSELKPKYFSEFSEYKNMATLETVNQSVKELANFEFTMQRATEFI